MDTQVEEEAEALLDALCDTLGEIKADIFFARQWLMWRAKNTMHYSLPGQMRTHLHVSRPRHRAKQKLILSQDCWKNTVFVTLIEVEAEALVYTQADTFPQVQTKYVTDTLTRY